MREDVLEFMYWILQTVHTNAVLPAPERVDEVTRFRVCVRWE